jgi:hypothetical protein
MNNNFECDRPRGQLRNVFKVLAIVVAGLLIAVDSVDSMN